MNHEVEVKLSTISSQFIKVIDENGITRPDGIFLSWDNIKARNNIHNTVHIGLWIDFGTPQINKKIGDILTKYTTILQYLPDKYSTSGIKYGYYCDETLIQKVHAAYRVYSSDLPLNADQLIQIGINYVEEALEDYVMRKG